MRNLIFLYFLILLWSCANPMTPSGGPIDEVPPRLILAESTTNNQTNFRPTELVFVFDEWIQLVDLKKQMIISPPLEHSPRVIHKGKKLILELDEAEVLQPNTTYSFQFGEAIKDLTEGNVANNLKLVFSTGPQIDSLTVKGQVIDAMDEKPVTGVIVMLYRDTIDSIPYLQKPIFVSRSDSAGNFEISNLPNEEFKIFALEDKNLDYLFNGKTERIAFDKNQINAGDSAQKIIILKLFQEVQKPKITGKKSWRNKVSLQFNRPLGREEILVQSATNNTISFFKDSMNIWLNDPWDSIQLVTLFDGRPLDTSTIKLPNSQKMDTSNVRINKKEIIPHLVLKTDSLNLVFNKPITQINADLFLLKDSTGGIKCKTYIDPSNPLHVICKAAWKENEEYRIKVLPEGVTAINGKTNKDTINLKFRTLGTTTTGNILMRVEGGIAGTKYLTQLSFGEKIVKEEWITADTSTILFSYKGMKAGKYSITIVEDLNRNRKWDTGKYLKGKQPERIFEKKLEALRENWDLDVTVNLNNATTSR